MQKQQALVPQQAIFTSNLPQPALRHTLTLQPQSQPALQQTLDTPQQPQQTLIAPQQLQPAMHQALAAPHQPQTALQQAFSIQQQLQAAIQQALAIPQLQSAQQFSFTWCNCTINVPAQQPQPQDIVAEDYSSIDINEFLQF